MKPHCYACYIKVDLDDTVRLCLPCNQMFCMPCLQHKKEHQEHQDHQYAMPKPRTLREYMKRYEDRLDDT